MSKKIKAFLYNFIAFAIIFIPARFVIEGYTNLTGYWIPIVAFILATFVSPKFQAVTTKDGEKLFVKWPFLKGLNEIK
jgi:hypothetical protein